VGANRGYYAFQAADILGDRADIHAIEPGPQNVFALERGRSANGFGERVHIRRCAFGNENTVSELNVSSNSNCHTLGDIPDSMSGKYRGGIIETEVYTVDRYLKKIGKNPSNVDVVRMDVEGYEWHVFSGMKALIESNSPLVLFVELHPHRVEYERLAEIIDGLENTGFSIVSASSKVDSFESFSAIKSHLDTEDHNHTVELIVRR
jgi:FkbM family methyltransferase